MLITTKTVIMLLIFTFLYLTMAPMVGVQLVLRCQLPVLADTHGPQAVMTIKLDLDDVILF